MTVLHLQASRSERIVWLCEPLDIPYELEIDLSARIKRGGAGRPHERRFHGLFGFRLEL
jgi:hypothetical protein